MTCQKHPFKSNLWICQDNSTYGVFRVLLTLLDEVKLIAYFKRQTYKCHTFLEPLTHYPKYMKFYHPIQQLYNLLEFQWRQAPPCSSWDTGRVVPLVFTPGVKS